MVLTKTKQYHDGVAQASTINGEYTFTHIVLYPIRSEVNGGPSASRSLAAGFSQTAVLHMHNGSFRGEGISPGLQCPPASCFKVSLDNRRSRAHFFEPR
jgi:hypothetical protein